MIDATENPRFQEFMKIVDRSRTMGVRTNADTAEGQDCPFLWSGGHRSLAN
ncbi:MAG: hypothetical protein WA121_01610 [Syntrophales bacterium]